MSTIDSALKTEIVKAFQQLFDFELSVDSFSLQPTRKEFEGTHTLVVFPYLKQTRKSPEESGKMIGEYLKESSDLVADYNVVKGFLNLSVAESAWIGVLNEIAQNENFGDFPARGQKVMVEFSSPNTNKPLHLGHLRNNFLGDAVSRILEANGFEVMKVNLVNDRGIHICKSMLAYQLFGAGETPESSGVKGDHLIGKYYVRFDQEYKREIEGLVHQGMEAEEAKKQAPLMLQAQEMLKKWEDGDEEVVALWKKMNGWVFDGFDASYQTMGIDFDKIYYESDTYLLGKDIIEEGLGSEVFFKKEDGSVWVDLTKEKLDEKLVLRGDGTSVYITQDMGTCDLKHQDFPFEKSVYVVGNEQDYHFKVLFSIMKKLGRDYADGLYHLSYGMVDLPSGKMKSREGTVVDADDLMQEMFDTAEKQTRELGKIEGLTEDEAQELYRTLGLGALKYFLLKVDPKKRMLFNPQESIEFQGNTGPFIQYTHARISAILRRAKGLDVSTKFDPAKITSLLPKELELIHKLTEYTKTVDLAAEEYSPALIAQYVYELAKTYNGFYQDVPIFNEDNKEAVKFRVALSQSVARLIRKSMLLLGIHVPERM
ncbi:arginine--tRNA ligase [Marinoscillum furvescens]|uniref:Arginine--tRNA ligase n=1 Tax=Marinoscillum furvescens DSM 4134 TaxID=1122208 RepID=A0A3D9L6S7_MARFU|nr:arginine--tRNA ligase [Marinoscillum furvescens]REE02061.1 arginyl-tRNA synthetase [Marinoscillum furvescens DSM 4134]